MSAATLSRFTDYDRERMRARVTDVLAMWAQNGNHDSTRRAARGAEGFLTLQRCAVHSLTLSEADLSETERDERDAIVTECIDATYPPRIPGVVLAISTRAKCRECGRVFDLTDETDAAEWSFGHDCEAS